MNFYCVNRYGAVLLALRARRSRGATGMQQPLIVQGNAATVQAADTPKSDARVPGEYETLDIRQFVWISYVCFVAG